MDNSSNSSNGQPPPPAPASKIDPAIAMVHRHAEWLSVGVVVALLIIWGRLMPTHHKVYDESDLVKRIQNAQIAKDAQAVSELERDLAVWNRYEGELCLFEWGKGANWYIFASLRVLVIVLSAITPAWIVTPALQNKKFLVVLPAAIVAIGTGLISEFDFRMEAARYGMALVRLQGEKTAFISQSPPLYGPSDTATANAAANPTAGPRQTQIFLDVPFPQLDADQTQPYYPRARANFAFRIEQIIQEEASERDQFLRGGNVGTVEQSAEPNKGAVRAGAKAADHPIK